MGKKKWNSFYFFMIEMRNEVLEWQNKSNQELMILCGPLWEELSPEEKNKYEEMKRMNDTASQQERKKGEVRGDGYDTHGRPLDAIKKRDEGQIRDAELKKIHTNRMVIEAIREKRLEQKEFFLIEVNVFCETPEGEIMPAEISIAKFSLQNGITKILHEFIKPGKIPFGYTFIVKDNIEKTHKIELEQKDDFYFEYKPDDLERKIVHQRGKGLDNYEREVIRGAEANLHYKSISEEILKFLDMPVVDRGIELTSRIKPTLFTMPGSVGRCEMSLNWLFDHAKCGHFPWQYLTPPDHSGHSPWTGYIPDWRILELPQLLYELSNTSTAQLNTKVKSIPTVSLAEHQLEMDTFKFADGMSCDWHIENDEVLDSASGSDYCTSTAVRRWSYIMADHLCQQYGIKLRGGHHIPKEADTNPKPDMEWENLPGLAIRPPTAITGGRSSNTDIRFRNVETGPPYRGDIRYGKDELKLPETKNLLPDAGRVFQSTNTISEFMDDTSTSGRSVGGYFCGVASVITDFTDARSCISMGTEEVAKSSASVTSSQEPAGPKRGVFRHNAAMAGILGNREKNGNICISTGRGKNPSSN